jgi:hypothetical protein
MDRESSAPHQKGSIPFLFDDLFGRDRKGHAFIESKTPDPRRKNSTFSAKPEHPRRFR